MTIIDEIIDDKHFISIHFCAKLNFVITEWKINYKCGPFLMKNPNLKGCVIKVPKNFTKVLTETNNGRFHSGI